MVMQMRLWHICVAEPPCEPRQIDLEHLSMSYRRGRPRKSMRMAMSRGRPRKSMTCQGSFASHDIVYRQVMQYGGTHSAALRSALLPFPASSLPRELVSGRHLPLPEAVGWPRPPYRTTWRTTWRLRGPSSLKNEVSSLLANYISKISLPWAWIRRLKISPDSLKHCQSGYKIIKKE